MNPAPSAFRQQLLGAVPRLRRYARSLAFEEAQADDLVQSTLERALTHWHQFDQRRDMLVWLLSIAHNAHLDMRRRQARMQSYDPLQLQIAQDSLGGEPDRDELQQRDRSAEQLGDRIAGRRRHAEADHQGDAEQGTVGAHRLSAARDGA